MEIKQTRDTLSPIYIDALKIRNNVFVKEQGVPFNLEMESSIEEAHSIHFVGYVNDKPVGTVRLLINKESSIIQRMAVLKEERSKGYAAALLSTLIDFAKIHNITELTLHAQLSARGLYTKYDFKEYGDVFEEAGIQHITMKKTLN